MKRARTEARRKGAGRGASLTAALVSGAALALVLSAGSAWAQGLAVGGGGGGGRPGGGSLNLRSSSSLCCADGVGQLRAAKDTATPPLVAHRAWSLLDQLHRAEGWRALALVIELEEVLPFLDGEQQIELTLQAAGRLTSAAKVSEAQQLAAARLRFVAAQRLLDLGRAAEADKLLAAVGFVRAWSTVGPFENRNMAGFDVNYPPEGPVNLKDAFDGKQGSKIQWLRLPFTAGGVNDPGAGVNPNRGALVYTATALDSPRKQKAVLRLGVEGAYKVWLNGRLVGRVDSDLGGQLDADAFGVELQKGRNVVLVKVAGENRGRLAFTLRVTEVGGAPLALAASPTLVPGEVLAAPGSARGPGAFDVAGPVAAATTQARAATTGRAEELVGAAVVARALKPLDPGAPWRDLAREAVAASPDSFDVLVTGATTLPEHWQRLAWLEQALKLRPQDLWARLRVAEEKAQGMGIGRIPELLGLLDRLIADIDAPKGEEPALLPRLLKARLLLAQGQPRGAATLLSPLAARYTTSAPLLVVLREIADRMGDLQGAMALARQLGQAQPGQVDNAAVEARMLLRGARPEEALKRLDAALAARPEATGLVLLRSRAAFQRDQPALALATLDEALARSPGQVELLSEKATLLEHQGEPLKAAEVLDLALAVQPENRALEERVRALRPETSSYEAPFRWDISALDPPADAAAWAGHDFAYLGTQQVALVSPTGQSSRFTQNIVQVLTEEGARTWRNERVYYSPGHERVDIVAVRVRKRDGTIVEVHERKDYDAGQGTGALYYQQRFAYLDVGAIEPGDIIEYSWRQHETAEENFREGYFGDLWYFETNVPIARARYVIITPESMTIHVRQPEVPGFTARESTQDVRGVPHAVRVFEAADVAPVRTDNAMPGRSEIYDYILVSTYKTWDEVGRWWWNLIKDQLIVDAEIEQVVKEVTRGIKNERDKVRAIHNWVVKNTRYVGIEFGVHGWKPYRTTLCMQRRFGDCKDKASLIKVMLQTAGIEANLVLIRTNQLGGVSTDPANLAIFNHAIAYVPKFNLFLDGTAEFSGTSELPWSDQGTFAIIVKDGGAVQPVQTPVDRPEQNYHLRVLEVDLSSGAAIVKAELEATGADAVWYRRTFDSPEEAKRNEALETIVSRLFPGARLKEARYTETRDLEKPVRIEFSFSGGGFVKQVGDQQALFPAGREIRLLDQYAPQATRDQDLILGVPFRSANRVRYKLPDYLSASRLPQPVSGKSAFGTYNVQFKQDGATLEMEVSYDIAAERIKVADYAAFRAWLNELDRALNQPILLQND